jgi:hypothetical protein
MNMPTQYIIFKKVDIPSSYLVVEYYVLTSETSKALPYINSNFSVIKMTAFSDKWDSQKLLEYLDNRFNGHPDKIPYLTKRLEMYGKYDEVIEILHSEIDSKTDNWDIYHQLGTILIKKK